MEETLIDPVVESRHDRKVLIFPLSNVVLLGFREGGMLFRAETVDGVPVWWWRTRQFTECDLEFWYRLVSPPDHWWGLLHCEVDSGVASLVAAQSSAVSPADWEAATGLVPPVPVGDPPLGCPAPQVAIFVDGVARWRTVSPLQPLVPAPITSLPPGADLGEIDDSVLWGEDAAAGKGTALLEIPKFRGWWWLRWRRQLNWFNAVCGAATSQIQGDGPTQL